MVLSNICCCCGPKNDNVKLESEPSSGAAREKRISSIGTPQSIIEPEQKHEPVFVQPKSESNKPIAEPKQPIITEQPKKTVKFESTSAEPEHIENSNQSNEDSNRKRENLVVEQDITHLSKRPVSESVIHDIKKQYKGYNNFAFVDEIDTATVTTGASITASDISVRVTPNGDVTVDIGTEKQSIHVVDGVINTQGKPANDSEEELYNHFSKQIDELATTFDDKESRTILPPSQEDLDFNERRISLLKNSLEKFIQDIGARPQVVPRTTINKKQNDAVDSVKVIPQAPSRTTVAQTASEAKSLQTNENIRLSCLEAHNRLRARHGCPALKESRELNELAENWAFYLLKNGSKLVHRPNNKFGENLYWTTDRNGHVTLAVQAWYDEIKLYNFKNPGFSKETGHFTQLLWRDTLELGTALVKDDGNVVVVCNYNPPGNYNGEFNDYTVPQLIAEDHLTNQMIRHFITNMRESSVRAHNRIRALHGCPPLQENEELNAAAEEMLNYVEEHGKIPSLAKNYGRNCLWSSNPFPHISQVVQFWYDDGIKNYAFDAPKADSKLGGFVQVIWRDSIELGTAIRRIGNEVWFICLYNPSRLSDEMYNDYYVPRLVTDKLHVTLESDPDNMRLSSLDAHNRLRKLHGCPPLIGNAELDQKAESWAKHLAAVDRLVHQANGKHGENLFWTSNKLGHVTMAVQSWYDEIKSYDFDNPGFSGETGHFTQLIWKDSVELGTGIAKSGDGLYVVCLYNPPGNFSGRFNDYYIPRPLNDH